MSEKSREYKSHPFIVRVLSEHPLTLQRVNVLKSGAEHPTTGYARSKKGRQAAREHLRQVSRQHGGYLYLLVDKEITLEIE